MHVQSHRLARLLGVAVLLSGLVLACAGQPAASPTTAPAASSAAPTKAAAPAQAAPTQAAAAPAPAKPAQKIKVGLLAAKSGSMSLYGESPPAAQFIFEKVNAAGGIKSMGGAQIEWVYADTQSETSRVAPELERLVNGEKVDAIIFSSPTAEIYAGATVYDKLKIPVISTIATSEPLFDLNLKYWRMVSLTSSDYGSRMAETAKLLKDEYNIKTDRIAFATSDAPQSFVYRDAAIAKLKTYGLDKNIVANVTYSTKTTDQTSVVLQMKAANPDVVIVNEAASVWTLWWKAAHDVGFNPPVTIYALSQLANPNSWTQLGEQLFMDRIATKAVFSGALMPAENPHPNFQKLRKELVPWVESKGWSMTDYYILNAQAANAFVAAWEKAGTKDPEKVNETLRSLVLPENDPYFVGPSFAPALKWEPNGRIANFTMPIVQWQGKETKLIYPKEYRTGEPKLPK